MNVKLSPYQRAALGLLRGQPRPKPCGRFNEEEFLAGYKRPKRTKQQVAWNRFWRLKLQLAWSKVDNKYENQI